MNRVFFQDYNALCSLGDSIHEIYFNMQNQKCGIRGSLAPFSKNSVIHKLPVKNLFNELCLSQIKKFASSYGLNFMRKDTILILTTTKGNIKAISQSPKEASISNTIQFLQSNIDFYNEPFVISNACISGVLALNYAHDFISNKVYKNVVVVASDLLSDFVISGFTSFQALSKNPCKPYDIERDGINLGEAFAIASLSSKENEIELLPGASSNDANHISGPSRDGSGLALAIKKSMLLAKIKKVDIINAHGTATNFNDEMEAQAFNSLNMQQVDLISLKGYFGHTLAAAGLIESLICIEMIKKQEVLKSMGFKSLGLSKPLQVVKETKVKKINTVLKTASGFGGGNAALILKKNNG